MRHTLVSSVILLTTVAIGLTGCATNTRQENKTIGVVSGAIIGGAAGSLIGAGTGQVVAIGVGAAAGGLLGGYIGDHMESSDNQMAYQSMATGQPTHWSNNKTHYTYSVVPTGNYITVNGNPNCRRFKSNALINGKNRHVHGVACRLANGTWQIVNPSF